MVSLLNLETINFIGGFSFKEEGSYMLLLLNLHYWQLKSESI